MIDNYLANPHDFENFYFRLRTEDFPRLAAGSSMRISLMLDGANDVFISNYSFFRSTKEQMKIVGLEPLQKDEDHGDHHQMADDQEDHHKHHGGDTIPKFYFDYEKLLYSIFEIFTSSRPSIEKYFNSCNTVPKIPFLKYPLHLLACLLQ